MMTLSEARDETSLNGTNNLIKVLNETVHGENFISHIT